MDKKFLVTQILAVVVMIGGWYFFAYLFDDVMFWMAGTDRETLFGQ